MKDGIKKSKIKELSIEEQERRELMLAADEEAGKGQQLLIDVGGGISVQKDFLESKVIAADNPQEKYRIYYSGIQKLLLEHLPKGERYQPFRQHIYDEKNIFLTEGYPKGTDGIRGRDSRMGYKADMQKLLDVTVSWIVKRGTMLDLYTAYWQLNEDLGYDHQNNILDKKKK